MNSYEFISNLLVIEIIRSYIGQTLSNVYTTKHGTISTLIN